MPDLHTTDLPTISELFQAYYDCRKTKRNSASALLFEERLAAMLSGAGHASAIPTRLHQARFSA